MSHDLSPDSPSTEPEPMQLSSDESSSSKDIKSDPKSSTDSSSYPAALAIDDASDSSAVHMLDWSERTSSGIEDLPSTDTTSASSVQPSSSSGGAVGGQSESGYSEGHSNVTTEPSVEESSGHSDLPRIKIGSKSGKTKYVAMEVDMGERGLLKIIRPVPYPFSHKPSHVQESYVSGRVNVELIDVEGVSQNIIGFGSVEHDVQRMTLTLHEEGTPVFGEDDAYLSVQTRLFVDLVRLGSLGRGYKVYYVDSQGQRSTLYVCPERKDDPDSRHSPPFKKMKPTN